MLILSQRDLRAALDASEVIEAVEQGFRLFARGEARVPERLHLEIPEAAGVMLEMPAFARSTEGEGETFSALGTKVASVFMNNTARGLDIVQAIYLLLDGETGAPLALMEGRFLTGIRTAAVSAVATKRMAGPGPKRLAVLGAGVQAEFHIEAMVRVADVRQIMISSRTEARARAMAERAQSLYSVECLVVSPQEAASKADLICCCTNATEPLIKGALLRPGAHINAVGSFKPDMRELDSEAVRRSRVIIDDWSAAGREAGEIRIPLSEGVIAEDHIKGTLADLVTEKVAGRTSPDEITLFKSCGLALEDLVTARLAYDRAKAMGLGISVEIR
ncbi:MAG: ornithine cyclodeaminase family protein [Blastocatellia bacterium]|nr:ornithine cyclodeaminase family protein [Blastocatellia bacterium]